MEKAEIRSQPKPGCPVCGTSGETLYENLRDQLFGAPGTWTLSQCPTCGLIWLNPQPLESEILKAYQTYYTHDHAHGISLRKQLMRDVFLSWHYGYPRQMTGGLLKALLTMLDPTVWPWAHGQVMYLHPVKNGRLLDIGCGSGEFLERMQGRGWTVEGTELDPAAVETAREKGLNVRQGTLHEQQYPDNYFDAITMSHVIEHVYDPLGEMRECYRILKPGGKLVMVTPNNKSLVHRLFRQSWRGLEIPRHIQIFNIPAMRKLGVEAGFTAQVKSTARGANYIYSVSAMLKRHQQYHNEPFPKQLQIVAKLMQIGEWLLLRVNPHAGEELVFIGQKPE